ncbi:hypothetical protein CR513_04102, partial [Mucuna pruriens]
MDNGEVESESSSDDEMPPLEDCSNMEVVEPIDGVVLDTRCALSIQSKEDGDVEPLEHISHTRCLVQGKINIGEVKVDKQVSMPFAFENYKDEVLCDVLDRKVTHKGYTNCLSFIYNELKITLTPFSPKQVCEDQIKMRKVRV